MYSAWTTCAESSARPTTWPSWLLSITGMDAPSIAEDRETGLSYVTLHGLVTSTRAVSIWAAVDKCLAECPAAIVVDLRRAVFDTVTLSLLYAWYRRADEAGVALEYVASGQLARRMESGAAQHYLTAYRTLGQAAEAALGRPARRWVRQRLAPEPLASAIARNTVGDMCLTWGLRPLLYPARLLVGELVDNAVTHAGTDIELTVGIQGSYLHIRVRDGHPGWPSPRAKDVPDARTPLDVRGNGVQLLTRHATSWGTVSHAVGKTVWATLRLPPAPPEPEPEGDVAAER